MIVRQKPLVENQARFDSYGRASEASHPHIRVIMIAFIEFRQNCHESERHILTGNTVRGIF